MVAAVIKVASKGAEDECGISVAGHEGIDVSHDDGGLAHGKDNIWEGELDPA